MEYKLILTDPAEEESIEAYGWYESRKVGLGEELFEELDILYEFIQANPYLFPIKRKKLFHEAVVKRFPFVVIYEVQGNEIRILSVFKTPQNPSKKPK